MSTILFRIFIYDIAIDFAIPADWFVILACSSYSKMTRDIRGKRFSMVMLAPNQVSVHIDHRWIVERVVDAEKYRLLFAIGLKVLDLRQG